MVKNQFARAIVKGDINALLVFISGMLVSTSLISLLTQYIGVGLYSYIFSLALGIVVILSSKNLFKNKDLVYILNVLSAFTITSSLFLIFIEILGQHITNVAGLIIGLLIIILLKNN